MAVVAFMPTEKHRVHLQPLVDSLPQIDGPDIALVAGYNTLVAAKRRGYKRIVLAQHGAGQSYAGDPKTARNPGYPGGDKNEAVGLFLTPNEYSANRWRERYPDASVAVIGAPRIATLPRREGKPDGVVAVTFHWNAYFSPEANSAQAEFLSALPELARTLKVIGTGHPQNRSLPRLYEQLGIEYVRDFDEVCRRADMLLFDNTSAGFEFAATGRPVGVLNSRTYRREVNHGGRFWDWARIGINIDRPADLVAAVIKGLDDQPDLRRAREATLAEVYQEETTAAAAITQWALTTESYAA
jgi:hypothetical protein